jgi:N-sulfoglucosamine sulfohydrolase
LKSDPLEFKDLSSDPAYTGIKNRLFKALQSWQEETDDPLRFQDKLKKLTAEHDTMKISKNMVWHYPEYLYGEK